MAHVFNVGGALQELQSPFSATYFKLKAQKVAPTAKNSLADLREQFERLALLADQLESRSRELMQAAPAEPFGFGRASADGRDCSCTCLKRQLTELMAASRDKEDFTKDQILQRLNEIVYPERESARRSSLSMEEHTHTAKTPQTILPMSSFAQALKRQLDSNRSPERPQRPDLLTPHKTASPLNDQSIQTVRKITPGESFRRTETRKSVKTGRSVSHRNIASYLFQAPKLLSWLKNKFITQPPKPSSAKQVSFRKSRFLENLPEELKNSAPIQVYELPKRAKPEQRSKWKKLSRTSSPDKR